MNPKAFEGFKEYINLEDNNEEPIKKSINKDLNNETIVDVEEDEIEKVESDCIDLEEQEVIECEAEDAGVNKSTGFEALQQSMAEFMKHSADGYSFMSHIMEDIKMTKGKIYPYDFKIEPKLGMKTKLPTIISFERCNNVFDSDGNYKPLENITSEIKIKRKDKND